MARSLAFLPEIFSKLTFTELRMINFSKVGLKEELIAEIDALPASTISASEELVSQAKSSAKLLISSLSTNGASINLRANKINNFVQLECQVAGQELKK